MDEEDKRIYCKHSKQGGKQKETYIQTNNSDLYELICYSMQKPSSEATTVFPLQRLPLHFPFHFTHPTVQTDRPAQPTTLRAPLEPSAKKTQSPSDPLAMGGQS